MALFVTMLVIGGLGTFAGPMVGTALIMVVSEYLRDYPRLVSIILGPILLLTIVDRRRGDSRRRSAREPRTALMSRTSSNDAETRTGRRRTRHLQLPVSSSKGER